MKTVQRSPEPFFYPGGKTGILLLHGFTGTPSELRPMGQYFKDRGYTVHAPLLAGHGTSPEEMEQTGWRDWWQSAVGAYDRMRAEPLEKLYVAGLSMGGCLSLALAAQKPVDGVIPMCAPIYIRDRRAFLARVVAPFYRYKKRSSHRDPHIEAHLCPYDRTPVRCVAELTQLIRHVKSLLADVKVPALIVQAGKDELILEKSADYIYEHISSTDKEISWYERSTHIITVDRERNELFKEIEQFILERSS